MRVGGGGALDIRWCTKLRQFIYDHTHFPICFTAALPMDLQLIGPELVVEIRVEIKRRKHTYSRNSDTESYIVNNIVLISVALEGGGATAPTSSWLGGGARAPGAPLLPSPMKWWAFFMIISLDLNPYGLDPKHTDRFLRCVA